MRATQNISFEIDQSQSCIDVSLLKERVVYSLVIPVHNEENSLRHLWQEIWDVMNELGESYQLILVNDCSDDKSEQIIKELCRDWPERIFALHLPERSGQTFALKTGMCAAKGDYIITMDADLQNDPADIPHLLHKLNTGYDVVCGWRAMRQDKPVKSFLSRTGNRLQRLIAGVEFHDVSCTLRVYRKRCLEKLALDREGQHRFIPLTLHYQGYRIGEVMTNHRRRKFDRSKYRHGRIFKVVFDFFLILFQKGKR